MSRSMPLRRNEPALTLSSRDKRLILCLHDVSPMSFRRIREIDEFYEEIGAGARYAMLVVPNFGGEWSLSDHPEFVNWLKSRIDAGVELFLHGYFHFDTTPSPQRSLTTNLRHSIFGEGEFAAINEREAETRLAAGQEMFEKLFGRRVRSFVAPAWQYSPGAKSALARLGFQIAENRAGVWSPTTGRVLTRTPVIAYSSRTMLRRNSSLLWSRASTRFLETTQVVRHAIHPADFNDEELKREITRSLRDLMSDREIIAYRGLLDQRAAA